MRRVLVIDDNPAVGEALGMLLALREIDVRVAASPAEGLAWLEREEVDLVIQDMNFSADTTSGAEGQVLFQALRVRSPDLPVILLTAWTHLESAVQLVKAGAADYLAKPWDDRKLLTTVENLLELAQAQRESRLLRERQRQQERERARRHGNLAARFDLQGLVFASDAMARCVELACQVARSRLPVLVTGPNGAGKERIAAIVHANSEAREGPFVAVNCGAMPAELIEAELFGAESGAYTGAQRARAGRFEAADGGTLFLDEIGNLPLAGQIKLLRVLETGAFERLGSTRTQHSRARVLSATNADLRVMVAEGRFREDLYYRLNVVELRLPALAERREDIEPLAEHFLARRAILGEEARELLRQHDWPGNVRELKNAIERAALLAGADAAAGGLAKVAAAHLGLAAQAVRATRSLDEPSRESVLAALQDAGGVISRAAAGLGLSRQALYRRMQRYGLDEER